MLMLITTLACVLLPAHPFHVSVAEAQWDADSGRLQVALRLSPRDLDTSLSKFAGRRVVLEKEEAEIIKDLVQRYLQERIFLASDARLLDFDDEATREKVLKRFHWVGIEPDVRYTWVYFELEPASAEGEVWLHNRVMFEIEETQINTLQLMRTKPPVAVRTTRQEPAKVLPRVYAEDSPAVRENAQGVNDSAQGVNESADSVKENDQF